MTIRSITAVLWISILAAAAACGGPPPPPLAPEPEPEEIVEPEPEPEPEIPLEERIRAPFAVQADGRVAARLPRESTVVASDAAAPRRQTPAAAAPAAPEPADRDEEPDEVTVEPVAAAPARPAAAQPTTPAPPASGGATPRDHTVVVGETFYGIARTYGVTPAALSAVNPGVDGERLRAGQVLRLPAYATRPAANGRTGNGGTADRAPADRATPPTARRTHRVEAGETLWAIARRYGVSMDAIRTANDLDGDTVRLGQTLVIP